MGFFVRTIQVFNSRTEFKTRQNLHKSCLVTNGGRLWLEAVKFIEPNIILKKIFTFLCTNLNVMAIVRHRLVIMNELVC